MDFDWLPQIDTTDILSVIVILQTGIILGRTPKPVAKLDGKTNLFNAEEIKAWHANRPGSPVKNHP